MQCTHYTNHYKCLCSCYYCYQAFTLVSKIYTHALVVRQCGIGRDYTILAYPYSSHNVTSHNMSIIMNFEQELGTHQKPKNIKEKLKIAYFSISMPFRIYNYIQIKIIFFAFHIPMVGLVVELEFQPFSKFNNCMHANAS